jgi:deoxyribose-phosphate aldolase
LERYVVTQTELDILVAQIGEEILSRVGSAPAAAVPKKGEGLNLPDQVCPGCVQRCVQTCAKNAKEIIAAGADRVSASERLTKIDPAIASLIDHTILKADATRADVVKVCREARQYTFASVCVNPYWVPLVKAELAGTPVKVCTVVGFPLGATSTEAKVTETAAALRAGAQEIDMVINVGALRSGDHEAVKVDIQEVVRVSHAAGAIVKVILETALLDDNQKAVACTLSKLAGADFVKTSTGFGPSGATAHDVALMRQVVGPAMGVKASGGIRTLADFRAMTAAGASRIGASASVKIVEAAA